MKCVYCEKDINGNGSLVSHQNRCIKNPNRVVYSYKGGRKKGKPAWNKGLTKETDSRIADYALSISKSMKGQLGKAHTSETKKKLSDIAKRNNFGGNTSKKITIYKGIRLQSSYELEVAKVLDEQGIVWCRPDPLKWIDSNSQEHRYYADFYIVDYDIYLDPKNDYLIENINPAFGITDREKIEKVANQNNKKIYILSKNQLTWTYIKTLL